MGLGTWLVVWIRIGMRFGFLEEVGRIGGIGCRGSSKIGFFFFIVLDGVR